MQSAFLKASDLNPKWPSTTLIHRLANIATMDIEMGGFSRIDAFVTITGKVDMGSRIHIATGTTIIASGAKVTLADGVGISAGVKIFAGSTDPHTDLVSTPTVISYKAKVAPVFVGMLSTLGAGCVLLPGAHVGDESMIGANAVVRGHIPAGQIWGGVPAKYIGPRKKLNVEKALGDSYAAIPALG